MAKPAADDQSSGYSPNNWANHALLLMDEAESLVRWASVNMIDDVRYKLSADAFWKVAHMLSDERERLEQVLQGKNND